MSTAFSQTPASDAFEVVRGVTYDKASSSTEEVKGYIPILRAGNIADGHLELSSDLVWVPQVFVKPEQLLEPGDIVMATSSGSIAVVGKTALLRVPWRGSFGAFCACLRPKGGWNPAFIAYYLQTSRVRRVLSERARGVNINNLRRDHIESLVVPKVELGQQHRIVAAIEANFSRLDAAAASLTRAKANLKRARASVLKAAVEGRLVPTEAALARAEGRTYEPASVLLDRILAERRAAWAASGAKGKHKEPVAPDADRLPELPEGWAWSTVEALASDRPRAIQSGPFGSSLLHSEFQATGKLVIGIDNVQDGYFSPGSQHRISDKKFEQLAKYEARPKDLVITVMATIGRCCVIPANIETAIITKHVYRVTLEHLMVVPEYVMAAVRSPFGREKLLMESKGQTRPGLNGGIIKAFPVALPPLAEQQRIVAEVDRRLSVLDALDAALDANLARCARLRQSILKRAFEGRLVPAEAPAAAASSDALAAP